MRHETNPRLGLCFELSAAFVIKKHNWTLVHGRIHSSSDTPYKSIVHAWCERGEHVYDPVMDLFFTTQAYDRMFHAERFARYDWEQAAKQLLRTQHYGPWQHHARRKDKPNDRA